MDKYQTMIAVLGAVVTILSSVGGAWMAVKTLLARHDEKIDRIERDIDEMRVDRKSIDTDLKSIFRLISKMDKTLGILEERTKR